MDVGIAAGLGIQAREDVRRERQALDEQAAAVADRSESVHGRETAVTAREEEAARREAEAHALTEAASSRDAHANHLLQQLQEDRASAVRTAAEIEVRSCDLQPCWLS